MKEKNFRFNDKQMNAYIEGFEKALGLHYLFYVTEDPSAYPGFAVLSNGEGSMLFSSVGLSKHVSREFGGMRIEVILPYWGGLEWIGSDDLNPIKDLMLHLSKDIILKGFKGIYELNDELKDRFGYDYLVFFSSGMHIKVKGVGLVMPLFALPIYEAEMDYLMEYLDDGKRWCMLAEDAGKWYKEHNRMAGSLNIRREQLAYV